MRKKVIITIIMCVTMLLYSITVNAANGSVNLKVNETSIKPGENFTVTLSAQCDDGINGIEATYNYDENKLELVNANVANQNWIDMSGGREKVVEVMCNTQSTIKSDDILILTFKVKDNVEAGTADVSINDIKVDSDVNTSSFTESSKTVSVNVVVENSEEPKNDNNSSSDSNNSSNSNDNTSDGNNANNTGSNSKNENSINNSNNPVSSSKNNSTSNNNKNTTNVSSTKQVNNTANSSYANKALPKTGNEIIKTVLMVLMAIMVIAIFVLLFFYIRLRKIEINHK